MWKNLLRRNSDKVKESISDYKSIIDSTRIPKHIAVIMDGNGRWAKKKGLLRSLGHKAGVEALRGVVKTANYLGVKLLTAYAFSTENWKRPQEEVDFLMNLFSEYLVREIDALNEDNIKITFIGKIGELSPGLQDQFENAKKRTSQNTGLVLNLAVNYGSQAEITRSVQIIAQQLLAGEIALEDVNETLIEDHLYTAGLPPVDLLIRPSGDMRVSNFLLWQIAYAEFWFTDINWPDFKPKHLLKAIYEYQQRDRRFGGLNQKK